MGKTSYDPEVHHRRSIRLKQFDYSQTASYFITLCTMNKLHLFGKILNGKMLLNGAGEMLERTWRELAVFYANVYADLCQVMPDHFHGILRITAAGQSLTGSDNVSEGQPQRVAPTLYDTVARFKSLTTTRYIHGVKEKHWPPFTKKLWQRNYYEHIIRNNDDYHQLRTYVINNPFSWKAGVGAGPCACPQTGKDLPPRQ